VPCCDDKGTHLTWVHAPTEDKIDNVEDNIYEEMEYVFNKFHEYDMKILLGGFNAKEGREDTLNQRKVMKVYMKLVTIMKLE
jgi:hypothetical protein